MELLVIRHAEPVRVTAEETRGAPADPGLTERGQEQARRLAAWLATEGIDHVVSSPLRRATETAAPIAAALGLEIEIDEELCEYDKAADAYIPIEEMRAEKDERWLAMVEGRWEDFGGEPPDRFRARIVPCLDRVIEAHPGRRVAAVCHGGVINVYLAALLGLDRHLWFDPGYTSISRVRAARSGPRSVASINETAHLVAIREVP
ncbi:MAG: histidine phosphatase family protein [Acidimicrobiia bacterium]